MSVSFRHILGNKLGYFKEHQLQHNQETSMHTLFCRCNSNTLSLLEPSSVRTRLRNSPFLGINLLFATQVASYDQTLCSEVGRRIQWFPEMLIADSQQTGFTHKARCDGTYLLYIPRLKRSPRLLVCFSVTMSSRLTRGYVQHSTHLKSALFKYCNRLTLSNSTNHYRMRVHLVGVILTIPKNSSLLLVLLTLCYYARLWGFCSWLADLIDYSLILTRCASLRMVMMRFSYVNEHWISSAYTHIIQASCSVASYTVLKRLMVLSGTRLTDGSAYNSLDWSISCPPASR